MNKLLREVPTVESWILGSGISNSFLNVTLDEDFITNQINILNTYLDMWLVELSEFSQKMGKDLNIYVWTLTKCVILETNFKFLIDGTARNAILSFIDEEPKFEDICKELKLYNGYYDNTQELSSLEYFTFIR